MEEKEIYEKAVKLWGVQFQTDMMIEEMSELTKAILKHRRGKNTDDDIISEMADVQIMINQMRVIMNNESKWERWKSFKLDRLQTLVESDDRYE